MPRKKWINRNDPSTQTYQLLYRAQDDPLLHDENAGERALFPVTNSSIADSSDFRSRSGHHNGSSSGSVKGLHLSDLEAQRDVDLESMRENEGEAAQYGVYYDDSTYDYMQHLRDLGEGGGGAESHFMDAVPVKVKGKGKGKAKTMKLEDALRQVNLDDEDEEHQDTYDLQSQSGDSRSSAFVDGFSTFSKSERQRTYQDQQDVPDDIAGFQPDMDPRLREVLEALDDDAYVDDQDTDDVFGALGIAGKSEGEIDLNEFEANYFDEDDGWESDVTEKAAVHQQPRELTLPSTNDSHEGEVSRLGGQPLDHELSEDAAAAAAAEDGDWLRDFAKYKRDVAASKRVAPPADGSVLAPSATNDRAPTLYTLNGTPLRQKKRKGALTNPSAYSMTSSSLARTDGLQLLDARFDQVEKMYALDENDEMMDETNDGGISMVSGMTGMTGRSKMSTLSTTSFADEGAVRTDFDGMMDDFLGGWDQAHPGGKRKGAKGKRGKNGNEKFGLAQLEEVRTELGRGRIYQKPQRA